MSVLCGGFNLVVGSSVKSNSPHIKTNNSLSKSEFESHWRHVAAQPSISTHDVKFKGDGTTNKSGFAVMQTTQEDAVCCLAVRSAYKCQTLRFVVDSTSVSESCGVISESLVSFGPPM